MTCARPESPATTRPTRTAKIARRTIIGAPCIQKRPISARKSYAENAALAVFPQGRYHAKSL
jgi:hypothetical protein